MITATDNTVEIQWVCQWCKRGFVEQVDRDCLAHIGQMKPNGCGACLDRYIQKMRLPEHVAELIDTFHRGQLEKAIKRIEYLLENHYPKDRDTIEAKELQLQAEYMLQRLGKAPVKPQGKPAERRFRGEE
jgi:hypothetical protein